MTRPLSMVCTGMLLAFAACTQTSSDFVAKDVDKLAAHYTEDAVLMAAGTPAVNGREAIRAALKEMVGDNALSLKFEEAHVDTSKGCDFAYTQGSYTMTMTDAATEEPVSDKGSYVTVYRKVDATWKAVSDMASSSTPPPAPAANTAAATKQKSGIATGALR